MDGWLLGESSARRTTIFVSIDYHENMNRVVAVISKLESTHGDFPFSGFHIMLQFDLSSTASVVGSGDPYR